MKPWSTASPRMMCANGSMSIATWLKTKTIRLKCRPHTTFTAKPGPMWNGVSGIASTVLTVTMTCAG